MKKLSKIFSLVLSIALVVTSITFTPAKAETIQKKQFQFSKMMVTKDEYTSDYYYSDSYFADSSYNYNPHLATMSMCAACASSGNTMSDPVWSGLSKDIEALLSANGFDTIFVNEDFNKEPTKDSIGFVFAKKTINVSGKDYTLIAVNFRNANYGKEWFGNVNVGGGTMHEGFTNAADKAHEALTSYVRENGIKEDVKIWITGYSRGAAVSNILAKQLDDDGFISRASVEAEDIYAYAFATPAVTSENNYKKPLFKNIFNTISKYDVVPQVPPEQWGWHRYGVDIYLPALDDNNYAAKKARAQKFLDLFAKGETVCYEKLPGYKLNIDMSGVQILPTDEQDVQNTIDSLVSALTGSIKTSQDFNDLKPATEAVFDVIYDGTDEQKAAFVNALKAKIPEGEETTFLLGLLQDLMEGGDQAVDLIADCLEEAGIPLADPDIQKPAIKKLLTAIVLAAMSDLVGTTTAGLTIANNVMPFIGNHFNYKYLAWLQSLDSNYKLDSDNPPAPSKVTKPGKVKMKSAKRLSAKKVKVKFKKVKGAKGYQVKVYKGKKTYAKKYTKKTKITIKSKKIKKKKKLYVKVRAYKLDGKKKVFGKWSKAKKVKK